MRYLTIAILLAFAPFTGRAQCVIDTTLGYFQTSPSPVVACEGTPTEVSFAWALPKDTLTSGFTLTIDSVYLDSIGPLPAGISFACDQTNCRYLPGVEPRYFGCMTLSGTFSNPGVYPITLAMEGTIETPFLVVFTIALPIQFDLVVQDCTVPVVPRDISQVSIFPNPTSGQIRIDPGQQALNRMTVFDMNGRMILERDLSNNRQEPISLDLSSQKAGPYLIRLRGLEGGSHTRLIKVQ